MKAIALMFLLLCCGVAAAKDPPAATAREIGQLLVALGQSGCQFNRNGSWHSAGKAVSHLQRKFEHLKKKGLVTTTESFIELGATQSSVSGKPYLVKCAGAATVNSKPWFTGKLGALRKAATAPAGS